jgi:acetyl esterase/lipase
MPSIQAKFVKFFLPFRRYGWASGTIQEQRSRLDEASELLSIDSSIDYEPVSINRISGAWITPFNPKHGVTLYLHGGAYALGSVEKHRELLSRFAAATQRKVLAINYRLAPEHPFPAALDDSLAAYRWLISQGIDPSALVIAGDSAGGGLTLATLVALRDTGDLLPACVVCISPWVDLTLSSESMQSKAKKDFMLRPDLLARYADLYAGEVDKGHPLISPLFADLQGLPPVLIHVGTDEILLGEAIRFTEKARAAGVEAELKTWEGLFHVFQMVPILPESEASFEEIGDFIARFIP